MNFIPAPCTGLSKRRIFREKAVARMNRIRAAAFRDLQNLVDVEIRLSRSCGANGVGLVRHQNMQSGAIDIGKDSNRRIPISRQARITRTAISPRLATRIFLNIM